MRKNCHPKRKHPAIGLQSDFVGNQQSLESELRQERLRGHEYLEKLQELGLINDNNTPSLVIPMTPSND